ncbi:MAG: hypothetical protein HYR72_03145 [Deltaproteobacteria bacterium]|jgi:hypothetical protein|nr:hypothetical protein [Deltaproteobacteria bacterium]MBI3390033.1 hypothetical protein [Deltaproteobacteria bacterium]
MKKFMMGFVLGFGLMYWYLQNADRVMAGADTWMQKSASGYRGDRVHQAAGEVLGDKK